MLAREYMKGRQEGTFTDHRDHSTTLDYCKLLLHFSDYCYKYFYSAMASCESSTQTNSAEHICDGWKRHFCLNWEKIVKKYHTAVLDAVEMWLQLNLMNYEVEKVWYTAARGREIFPLRGGPTVHILNSFTVPQPVPQLRGLVRTTSRNNRYAVQELNRYNKSFIIKKLLPKIQKRKSDVTWSKSFVSFYEWWGTKGMHDLQKLQHLFVSSY